MKKNEGCRSLPTILAGQKFEDAAIEEEMC